MSQAPGRRPPRTSTRPSRSGAGSRAGKPDAAGQGQSRTSQRPGATGPRPANAHQAGTRPTGATASGPGRRARTSVGPAVGKPAPEGRKPHQSKLVRQIAVLALVLAAVALSLAYPFRDYLNQRAELASATAEQLALEQTVAELEEQQAALSDPDYIKAEAKRRLQYVTPGDTVYVVQAPAAPQTETDAPTSADPELKPWYENLWGTLSDPGGPGAVPDSDPNATPPATTVAPVDEYGQPSATDSVPETSNPGTGG